MARTSAAARAALSLWLATAARAVRAASPPPPYPPYYVPASLEQRCDHFNAQNRDTFRQRYLVNATHWAGPGAPILLYTGGEGDGIDSVFAHSGYVLELARELSALALFAEMRFFGESMPYGEEGSFIRSAERLGLLSIEQALADAAALVVAVRAEHGAEQSKVIALGGSLAGTLAFLLRAKYPALVHAALAASAPIFGYAGLTDAYGWYRVATRTFELQVPGCERAVRSAFAALLAATPAAIDRAFNTCAPATASTAAQLGRRLTDVLAAMAESSYPRDLSPVLAACKLVMTGIPGGLGGFARILVPPGKCLNASALAAADRSPLLRARPSGARRLARALGAALDGPRSADTGSAHTGSAHTGSADTGWYYLACTEVVHPIAANNVTDFFPPFEWDPDALARACRDMFGVEPRRARGACARRLRAARVRAARVRAARVRAARVRAPARHGARAVRWRWRRGSSRAARPHPLGARWASRPARQPSPVAGYDGCRRAWGWRAG